MPRKRKTTIPHEIFMRLDDVAFHVPDKLEDCTPEQVTRLIEEARHLIDMLNGGENWYDDDSPLQRGRMKASVKLFLAKALQLEVK